MLFRHCDIAHLIDYSILLYALGNKKIHVTHFIKAFALCGGLELKPQDLRAKLVFKKVSETANSVYHWTVSYTENLLFINEKSEGENEEKMLYDLKAAFIFYSQPEESCF